MMIWKNFFPIVLVFLQLVHADESNNEIEETNMGDKMPADDLQTNEIPETSAETKEEPPKNKCGKKPNGSSEEYLKKMEEKKLGDPNRTAIYFRPEGSPGRLAFIQSLATRAPYRTHSSPVCTSHSRNVPQDWIAYDVNFEPPSWLFRKSSSTKDRKPQGKPSSNLPPPALPYDVRKLQCPKKSMPKDDIEWDRFYHRLRCKCSEEGVKCPACRPVLYKEFETPGVIGRTSYTADDIETCNQVDEDARAFLSYLYYLSSLTKKK